MKNISKILFGLLFVSTVASVQAKFELRNNTGIDQLWLVLDYSYKDHFIIRKIANKNSILVNHGLVRIIVYSQKQKGFDNNSKIAKTQNMPMPSNVKTETYAVLDTITTRKGEENIPINIPLDKDMFIPYQDDQVAKYEIVALRTASGGEQSRKRTLRLWRSTPAEGTYSK